MNKFVQSSEGEYIVCMVSRYLLTFINQGHVTIRSLSRSLYNRPTTLFGQKCGPCSCRNNETENIIVNSRYIIFIWMNEHLTLTLLTLLTLMSIFTHFNVIPSWKRSSVKKILCNVTPFFDHNSGVIQNLVSYWLFSLISKENVLNVR